MFTFDSIVDTIHGAQTKFVETYVTDKTTQKNLVKMLDTQAELAKTTYNNTLELAQTTVKNFNDIVSKKVGV